MKDPQSDKDLAFRHYDPDEMVLGKRDGGPLAFCRGLLAFLYLARRRPVRLARPSKRVPGLPQGRAPSTRWIWARQKADVAFEIVSRCLGMTVPLFSAFHDAGTLRPRRARRLAERPVSRARRDRRLFRRKDERHGAFKLLLGGTANLSSSNRRYMAGAATNSDPEIFAYAGGPR